MSLNTHYFLPLSFSLFISLSLLGCASDKQKRAQGSSQSEVPPKALAIKDPIGHQQIGLIDDSLTRVGEISATELIASYPKFKQLFDQFEANQTDQKNIHLIKDKQLVVFFGLWCHDSQREVSHFLKLIEQSGVTFQSLKLVAINTRKELTTEYKTKFKVTHTPTIFVLQDNQILAKMIEKPRGSITQDLLSQIFH